MPFVSSPPVAALATRRGTNATAPSGPRIALLVTMHSMCQIASPVTELRCAATIDSRAPEAARARRRAGGRSLRELARDVPGEYCFVLEPRERRQDAPAAEGSAASPDSTLAAGAVVAGRYRLGRTLQTGNMGTLFEAHDLRLDIQVAMKFVRAALASPQATGRLVLEARAAARVSHPSAVRVLDVGVSEHGAPFLVMEMLRGISLCDALATRRCPDPEEAVGLLLPIIGAVSAAHAEEIVHRDIKPQNIVLVTGKDGAVLPKLVDFGIARRMDEPLRTRITYAGTLIGSPEYMAPEQTLGRDVDVRADVWALCIVLHELVTGTTPFRRVDLRATLEAIQDDEPRPEGRLLREPELWDILCWGLAKELPRRCRSAHDLGRALASWAMARGIDADASAPSLAARWLGSRAAES